MLLTIYSFDNTFSHSTREIENVYPRSPSTAPMQQLIDPLSRQKKNGGVVHAHHHVFPFAEVVAHRDHHFVVAGNQALSQQAPQSLNSTPVGPTPAWEEAADDDPMDAGGPPPIRYAKRQGRISSKAVDWLKALV
jgi:hypothetical protein